MQVSVVIPTYNRANDLNECLNSIIVQTTTPKEIIIVDDSDNDEIKNLIELRNDEFKLRDIIPRYIRNEREKSLTIARNTGIEYANGDIILFLDSDVILDKHYIRGILEVYKKKPNAMGVQGLIQNNKKNKRKIIRRMLNILGRLHLTSSFNEKNKCRVFPSLTVSYPYHSLDEIINCEWLSGANQSYKKEILKKFRWDENLKKYSWGEDLDTSYRIFKKDHSSLFLTPYAKLVHKASQEGRHLKRDIIYMDIIYLTYLFYKNIDQNLKNKIFFIWGRIGRIIVDTIFYIPQKDKMYVFKANLFCLQHIKEIKRGDLKFFNKKLE